MLRGSSAAPPDMEKEASVSRPPVVVLPVLPDRPDDLIGLWLVSRVEQGASLEAASRYAADGRVEAALRRPDVHAFVAERDHVPIGYVVVTERSHGLSDVTDVAIDQLFVLHEARRHGVGRQLLAAVVAQAERSGCERVVSNVPSQDRDANRFFARLGFGASVVRRVTATSALRRRVLGGADVRSFESVVRRRRSLRAGSRTQSA